jgi:hypothetical protein
MAKRRFVCYTQHHRAGNSECAQQWELMRAAATRCHALAEGSVRAGLAAGARLEGRQVRRRLARLRQPALLLVGELAHRALGSACQDEGQG